MSGSNRDQEGDATLSIQCRKIFESLGDEPLNGKRYRAYAHHLARACWHGSRVILRQTSAEAEGIFDFILALYKACDGQWSRLRDCGLTSEQVDAWLEFSGMFLSSLGNYFDEGNRKVVPPLSKEVVYKMTRILGEPSEDLQNTIELMTTPQPANMGYPNECNQSCYYPGSETITKHEIEEVTRIMEARRIAPENTRLRKDSSEATFEIMQASAEKVDEPSSLGQIMTKGGTPFQVTLRRGDHSEEMTKICADLTRAVEFASSDQERLALLMLIESFNTGNYETFRDAQMQWVIDKAPRVEHCMGFLFGYRDPHGVRSEWQAAAGIVDLEETTKMGRLVEKSPELIRTLPWAVPDENDGKGPFEPIELVAPDFAIIHLLASISSTVWEATNISIDDDGERCGVKNMVFGNRVSLNHSPARPCYYVHPLDAEAYMSYAHMVRFVQTIIHELIGHGTGKLLVETQPGQFNFDPHNPPISPISNEPVCTWYKPGQTWNSVFKKLAPTLEECRAYLIANFLVDNRNLLGIFGYNDSSVPTADDFIYHAYIQIGVEGLQSLRSFKASDQTWGDDHKQALFAIFKHLLQDGNGVMSIDHDPIAKSLFVCVDRSKIASCGTTSIGRMLCKIHIWHCTADIDASRPFYEALSEVDGMYEVWRQIVSSNPEPKWKFLQPNTFINEDGSVSLKEYEPSNAGIIQSFSERDI